MEQAIEIHTKDGVCDGYLYQPAQQGRWPGILDLPDMGGVRPAYQDTAKRLCDAGYMVLLPNLFYRTARPPVLTIPVGPSPEFRARVEELAKPLTPEAMATDARAYIDFLLAQPSCDPDRGLAVLGYCFSGAMAMQAAAIRTDVVRAVATFHAGRLLTDSPNSPHHLLPQIKAKLYFAHASEDGSMPAQAIREFETHLAAWEGRYQSKIYPAHHGWTTHDHPAYDPAQAEQAFGELLDFLA